MRSLKFDDIDVHLSDAFGSASPDHRVRLRTALQKHIAQLEPAASSVAQIGDLSKPPRIEGWAISVSHCPPLGGFIAKKSARAMGLDFEISSRVSREIAARVAAFPREKDFAEEIEKLPLPQAIFWVAKEASIKAFGNRHPDLRPHFGIIEITSFDFDALTFAAAYEGAIARGRVFSADLNSESKVNRTTAVVGAFSELIS